MKPEAQSRITLAYSPASFDGQYLTSFPLIDGMKCTGWAADDLFQNYEDALKALAKIAVGEAGFDAADVAQEFFDQKRENPHSYYDWEEDEDEEEEP